jgi:hypothetical protein
MMSVLLSFLLTLRASARSRARLGKYREITLRSAVLHYSVAAVAVVVAALWLP